MRIDKFLSDSGIGTRTEVKKLIKKGYIKVDGNIIKDSNLKINPSENKICYLDEEINYKEHRYILLNKPGGVISATRDNRYETVVDLIEGFDHVELFPIGRLDIDTEGLLILSDDGKLAHELLSPKKHVAKKYYVEVDGKLDESDILVFENGMSIRDGKNNLYQTKPAKLNIITSGYESTCYVTIVEGKFHQIKRMFEYLGKEVTYLKRVSFGPIELDESLKLGQYRELTIDEENKLKNSKR